MITNPNIALTGMPGVGKSGTAKAISLRLMPYGVKTFVLGDIKNEYAPLARALGVEPVELGPGLGNRLNPSTRGRWEETCRQIRSCCASAWTRCTAAGSRCFRRCWSCDWSGR
ncbi:hypothetical protein ACFQ9X_17685 [Catenulispora yoronensis]